MADDRRLKVLSAIVTDYVRTREPVGSRALVERYRLGVSPATIRNDMAVLEDEGYIHQPHTSAGRVPTEKGYRLFVDQIARIKPLSAPERAAITTLLTGEADAVVKSADAVAPDADLADRSSMVSRGTSVAQGTGRAVVVATGADTEMGAIARMLDSVEEEGTPLQREITRISKMLGAVVIVIAVVYGLAWVAMSYARGGNPLAWSWQRPIMMGVGLILAFGEEIAVRGLILDRLERCGTGRLVQIVTTGAVMGVYHGVVGHHVWPSYMISSFVLFGLLSALYMYGRRSLTPPLIAHAMTHFLGDPTLMRGILYGVALAG